MLTTDPVFLTELSPERESSRDYDLETLNEAIVEFEMQLQVREAHEWKRVVYASDTVDIHADEHVCEPNMNADRFLKLSSEVIALCALHTSLEWLCELLKPRGELAQRARALSLEWTSPTIPLYRASRACMFILRTDARLRFSCIYFGGIRKLKVFTSSPTSVSVEGEAAHRRNAIAYVKGLAETLDEYLRPESLEYIFFSLSILVARLTCARLLTGPISRKDKRTWKPTFVGGRTISTLTQ